MQLGESRADANRRIRREALREQLEAQGHLQHVVDILDKLSDLTVDLNQLEVNRLKATIDGKIKLIDKYVPSLKAVELTGEDGDAIKVDNAYIIKVVE